MPSARRSTSTSITSRSGSPTGSPTPSGRVEGVDSACGGAPLGLRLRLPRDKDLRAPLGQIAQDERLTPDLPKANFREEPEPLRPGEEPAGVPIVEDLERLPVLAQE